MIVGVVLNIMDHPSVIWTKAVTAGHLSLVRSPVGKLRSNVECIASLSP